MVMGNGFTMDKESRHSIWLISPHKMAAEAEIKKKGDGKTSISLLLVLFSR